MKSLIFAITLLASSLASATEIRCIQTQDLKLEGMLFYVTYNITTDINDATKLKEVQFQSLADNGFYSEWPLELNGGIFVDGSHISFETTQTGDGTAQSMYVKYDPKDDNYKGSLFFESGDQLGIKCMKLKAF